MRDAARQPNFSYAGLAARVGRQGLGSWAVHMEALALQQAGEEVVLLTIGEEQDRATPKAVVEAAVHSLRGGRHHYAAFVGEAGLREAIVAAHVARSGQQAGVDNCVATAGAQNGLFAASLSLLQAGDEVVVVEPYYTTYAATFTAGGAEMVAVATQAEDGFMVDPEAVSGALSARTKAVVLNSPNNPSGAVYDAGRVRAVVDLCRAHNLWLLSDEVYADLAYAGPVAAPARFMGVEEKLVTVSSVSKSHRMTGWRIGWVVAPRELCRHIASLALCMNYGLPPFVQDAATAALRGEGDAELAELPAIFARRAAVVEAALSKVDAVRAIPPGAGIFMMLQLPAAADAARAAMDLLAAKKIAVLPCANFGRGFKRYLRLSLCYDEQTLARAAAEIADFFACYGFHPAASPETSP